MIDLKYAEQSRPSLEKVRKLIGVDDSEEITFVISIPCLYQGWESDPWAFVVKDGSLNRYLLMSHHGSWYTADEDELRKLISTYAEVGQAAIKGLIELTEGSAQDVARLTESAARDLGFVPVDPELIKSNPALAAAIEAASQATKKGQDGEA